MEDPAKARQRLRDALWDSYFGAGFTPGQRQEIGAFRRLFRTSLRPASPGDDQEEGPSLVRAATSRLPQAFPTQAEVDAAVQRRGHEQSEERKRFDEEHERAMAALATLSRPSAQPSTTTSTSPQAPGPRQTGRGDSAFASPASVIGKKRRKDEGKVRPEAVMPYLEDTGRRTGYYKVVGAGSVKQIDEDEFFRPK
jgi:hypothetical protein